VGTTIGIAAVGIVAVGLLAPQAAADPNPERRSLAPGIWCVGTLCRNDTDQTHRIDWEAICWNLGARQEWVTLPGKHTWAGPRTWVSLDTECPTEKEPGRWVHPEPLYHNDDDRPYIEYQSPFWQEGKSYTGIVRDARYSGAVPDDSQPPAPAVPSLIDLLQSGSAR
jgi:hypothetical protein